MSRLAVLEQRLVEMSANYGRLLARQVKTEARMDMMIRHGKVTDVDTKKQLARIELANKDGQSTKSDWRPYAQFAGPDGQGEAQGDLKVHTPPTVGQQMTMVSPNGEWRQGVIMPFTWHDKAQSPSQGADPVITHGKATITLKKDQLIIKVGDAVFEVRDDFVRGQFGDARFVASDSAAKIRKGDTWVAVDGGQVIVSHAPIIAGDPDGH